MKLRDHGVNQTHVLDAIERTPRELFVDPQFSALAHADRSLPIAHGQRISQPFIVGFMTAQLRLEKRMRVLEIGTGSGYQSAILARLCRRVYTLERFHELHRQAVARFDALQLRNITAMVGDGFKGWPGPVSFERIIVTAAAEEEAPQALLDQLSPEGIMIIPLENKLKGQFLHRITRKNGSYTDEVLLPVRFVPLISGVTGRSD